VKALARRIFPEAWQFGRWVPPYLDVLAKRISQTRVLAGPFRGVVMPDRSYASVYTAKLVGCYEREISYCIDELIAWNPSLVVDVGAAEGYYAVELAVSLPQAKIVAFEAEPEARAILHQTVALNQVGARVEINGYCTPETLATAINGTHRRTAVVMDCEGGEVLLLDLRRIPQLSACLLLVETHEFKVPGCVARLLQQLSATHEITVIEQTSRQASDYPFHSWMTPFLPKVYRMLAVYEHRPTANAWIFCKPKETQKHQSWHL
jgi:precorrin-6B methylase 2